MEAIPSAALSEWRRLNENDLIAKKDGVLSCSGGASL
jgi:hypothetical protein